MRTLNLSPLIIPALCAAAWLVPHARAQAPAPVNERTAMRFALHAEVAEAIREEGMNAPGHLPVAFFDAAAAARWKIDIASEFIAYQLSDFFTGALMLAGPQDGNGGVFGLYNPWWDAILLFQTKGALPESGDDKVVAPKVERFALLSGETFRGEKAATPGTATVMPGKDPFSTAIWRVQAATVKRFEAVYGESLEDPVQLRLATTWGAVDNRVEFERIQVRSAIRMKLALMLNKNSQDTAIAARVTDVLCNGSALRLKKHFQSQPHASFVKRLTELPGAFRAGFTVYGYVPTEAGSLFVFVNRQMPRFYATVSMPAGRIGDRSKGPVIFEWYDLASAAELITAWDNETKGGAQ